MDELELALDGMARQFEEATGLRATIVLTDVPEAQRAAADAGYLVLDGQGNPVDVGGA